MTQTIAELYTQRFGLDAEFAKAVAHGEVVTTLLSHRSHRRFLPDPVPDDLLEVLLACAFSAPSKSDLQQASVVRVIDEDKRQAIASLIPGMPWIGTAPEFMVFCGDSRRIRRICELRERPFANDHLDAFFNATVDAALTLQNLILAAEANGLGCCPISVIRNHATQVSEVLRLPAWVFPVAGLCFGYPAAAGHVMRLPLSVTVHAIKRSERADYDRRRDARYTIPEVRGGLRVSDILRLVRGPSARSRGRNANFGSFTRQQGFAAAERDVAPAVVYTAGQPVVATRSV